MALDLGVDGGILAMRHPQQPQTPSALQLDDTVYRLQPTVLPPRQGTDLAGHATDLAEDAIEGETQTDWQPILSGLPQLAASGDVDTWVTLPSFCFSGATRPRSYDMVEPEDLGRLSASWLIPGREDPEQDASGWVGELYAEPRQVHGIAETLWRQGYQVSHVLPRGLAIRLAVKNLALHSSTTVCWVGPDGGEVSVGVRRDSLINRFVGEVPEGDAAALGLADRVAEQARIALNFASRIRPEMFDDQSPITLAGPWAAVEDVPETFAAITGRRVALWQPKSSQAASPCAPWSAPAIPTWESAAAKSLHWLAENA